MKLSRRSIIAIGLGLVLFIVLVGTVSWIAKPTTYTYKWTLVWDETSGELVPTRPAKGFLELNELDCPWTEYTDTCRKKDDVLMHPRMVQHRKGDKPGYFNSGGIFWGQSAVCH